MSNDSQHPVYRPRPQKGPFQSGTRRCGKYDFGRFQNVRDSGFFLGSGLIGEMTVGCKFVLSKSKWGVLGAQSDPAGVVYLEITFTEPSGCQLQGATVTLTLDEYNSDLLEQFRSDTTTDDNILPVQICTHGPGNFQGPPSRTNDHRKKKFMPAIGAGGYQLDGMGYEKDRDMILQSEWRFSSQTDADPSDSSGTQTKIIWDLNENELDKYSRHPNKIHTAFAFKHDGQPFLMQVDVSGTLRSKASNLKYSAKKSFQKLRFKPRNQAGATTLVNFKGRKNPYKTSLDELADNIPRHMHEDNRKEYELMRSTLSVSTPEDDNTAEEISTTASSSTVLSPETERSHDALDAEDVKKRQASQLKQYYDTVDVEDVKRRALALLSLTYGKTVGLSYGMAASLDKEDCRSSDLTERLSPSPETVDVQSKSPSKDNRRDEGLPTNHQEELRKMVEKVGLPPILQIIIIWLLYVGTNNPMKLRVRRTENEEADTVKDEADKKSMKGF
ncbi:hypothetical protein F5Y16DRAFT_400502 [Xylariaceae sp. FL0255]|nr:hypothetical protein F5Y16DRAFT_400502 [Xylariaceae sp. FL0255]